jgi:hypothetical protein
MPARRADLAVVPTAETPSLPLVPLDWNGPSCPSRGRVSLRLVPAPGQIVSHGGPPDSNALLRAHRIEFSESIQTVEDWMVMIVADAEAGFGGPLVENPKLRPEVVMLRTQHGGHLTSGLQGAQRFEYPTSPKSSQAD